MPRKKKEKKKDTTIQEPTQKEKKKTSSTSEQEQKLAEAVNTYGPVLKTFGIGPEQIEFYIKLPQIMDAVATHMQQLEQRMDQLIGKAPAITRARTPKPPAPGSIPLSPPSAASASTYSAQRGSAQTGKEGGWLADMMKDPDTRKSMLKIAEAIAGTGEASSARTNTIKIAEAIEKSVLDKTLALVKKATEIRTEFKEDVQS